MKRSLLSSKLDSKSNNPSRAKVMRGDYEPAEKLSVPDSESESSEDTSGSDESESGSEEESNGDVSSSSASKSLKATNSEKANIDSSPKKTSSLFCQKKAALEESSEDETSEEESSEEESSEEQHGDGLSGSASEPPKDRSQAVALTNKETKIIDSSPKKTSSLFCQKKAALEESSEDETSEEESSEEESSEEQHGDGLSGSASEPPKDRSQAVALTNKETKIIDLNLKKTSSESCQNKAGSGSASESHKDRSRALSVKKSETNTIDLNLAPYQNKSGSGALSESHKDRSQTLGVKKSETNTLDLNPMKPVAEPYQNKAGSGAPSEPKKESPDLKHNVPAKRPLDEMSKENSQPKRLKFGSGREVATLMKTHAGFCYGLDETGVSVIWDTEIDGERRRELEEKLKRLKEIQFTLFLEQTQFVADATKVIVETLRNRK